MEVKKAKKVIARPVQVNSNQQSSTNAGVRTAVVIIPHDSFHESQIRIPAIRGNRTTYTHISSTFQVATLLL